MGSGVVRSQRSSNSSASRSNSPRLVRRWMRISGGGSLGTPMRWSARSICVVGPVEAVVPGAGRGVDLDPVDAEERFDLSIRVLDDRPRVTALGSLRKQQIDDARA